MIGIKDIKNRKVWLEPGGDRIISGLDFTEDPLLPYLERRFGLKNIYIDNAPITNEKYLEIIDQEIKTFKSI